MKVGRPPIYNSVEELLPKLVEWEDKVKAKQELPTVTGLCLAIGFDSKDTLYSYRDKSEFSYPIKRALLIVENGYEQALKESNSTGSIFALKNMGWTDQKYIDHTTKGEKINTPDFSNLTDDELRTLAAIQRKAGTY